MKGVNKLEWRKPSDCESASCVEVAFVPDPNGGVLIRTALHVSISATRQEWEAHIAAVKRGEYDWPAPAVD